MDNVNQPAAGGSKTGMWVALVIALAVIGVGAYFLFGRDNGTNTNNGNSVVNENANSPANQNLNANSNANSSTNVNAGGNLNVNSATTVSIDKSNWLTFTSSKYAYEFQYPSDSTVLLATKTDFRMSSEESNSGVTFTELFEQYTGDICVSLNYRDIGYVNISAPINNEKYYVICGRTGVGILDHQIENEENITIDENEYIAKSDEYFLEAPAGASETLEYHQETVRVELDNGTVIEFGSRPSASYSFQDYLQIRNILKAIVESYISI